MKTRLEEQISRIRPLDEEAIQAARSRQRSLVKPMGSLGELEDIAIRMAGITGKPENHVDRKIHFLFAADNGVYEEGVSGTPQYFTRTLLQNYADGKGCGIDTLCRKTGVELRLFDLGVKGLKTYPNIDGSHKLMEEGTENFLRKKAMPDDITRKAVGLGIDLAEQARAEGFQIIGTGEVGMANTTTATACIMASLGIFRADMIGRGGGLNDAALEKKKKVILEGLRLHRLGPDDHADPLDILSAVGGLDIAAMTGIYLGAALHRIPAVVDGVIAVAAALLAKKMVPEVSDFLFGSHQSQEPAYLAAGEALKLLPPLNLRMRLGEGIGCPLTMEIIEDALYLMNNMASFDEISLESDYREDLKF